MSRQYLSVCGLRVDGRRPLECRQLHCTMAPLGTSADGSALLRQGNTVVLASVRGPCEATKRSEAEHDRAVVSCEVAVAPFASSVRSVSRVGDRTNLEVARAVCEVFEAAVMRATYPRSEIRIALQVVQRDGGVLSACINAASMALVNAGIAMRDFVVACSIGVLAKTTMLDLNRAERSARGPLLQVAMLPTSGDFLLLKQTGRAPVDDFEALVVEARGAARQIADVLRNSVREHALGRLEARTALADSVA